MVILVIEVKPGEGFNLQREVFPRVGWIDALPYYEGRAIMTCVGSVCPRFCNYDF